MANKTFVSNGTFTVADNDAVAFGASVAGTEIVKILSGVTGVKLDANFEQIVLSGNLSTYKFLVVSGTGLQILATDGTTVIATVPNLNQVVKLVFADGFTPLEQTGSTAFKLGASSSVSTSTAGALTPTLSTGYTVSEFASAVGGIVASETITVSDSTSAINTDLALGASSVLLTNAAKIDIIDSSNNTDSVTKAQADTFITNGVKFASTDALTVTGINGATEEAAALTAYTKVTLGGTSVTLDASDNAWSIATGDLATAINATNGIKFASTDALTVTGITEEATALTTYTKALIGGTSVTLDASDNTWSISASDLSTATGATAGIILATGDVVTITGITTNGGQVIASSFQAGNDRIALSDGTFTLAGTAGDAAIGSDFLSVTSESALTGGSIAGATNTAKIIFLQDTGTLYYNSDGATAGGLTEMLHLLGVSTLANTDFDIIA